MGIIKSIYWTQTADYELVHQFPVNEITTGSVLTVNDGQEAYFFQNGSLYDKFGPGRHVLTSANIPLLNRIINIPSDGESTFKAALWFVSKLEKRNLLWGAGGLRVIDPYFQVPIKMAARGQYGVRIKDGALFLLKFVGTRPVITMDYIKEQFRIEIVEAVKVTLAHFMKEHNVNINELGSEYRSLAGVIAKEVQASFDSYGVELLNFNIEDISFDESDKGYQTVMEGIAEQAKLRKLGIDYMQHRQLDIAQTLAGNQGAGTFMGAGMGLGAGLGVGQQIGQSFGQIMGSGAMPAANAAQALPSFYVADNGKTTGPFRLDVLRDMILNGQVTQTTYVFRVGGSAWVNAAEEGALAQIFSTMAPPPPPPPSC